MNPKIGPPPWNLYCRCGAVATTSNRSRLANFIMCDACDGKADMVCGLIAIELIQGGHDIGFTLARIVFDTHWRFDRNNSHRGSRKLAAPDTQKPEDDAGDDLLDILP